MRPTIINCPSIANCNVLDLRKDIDELREAGVRWLHIDLMDGNYVPNLCFPLRAIGDLRKAYPDMTLDVHMMVTDPISYVERMAEAGTDYLSFHIDSTNFVIRTLERIKKAGMKAGVVVNPSQDVRLVAQYADLLDMVTLMAVEPGFAGQKFMPRTLGRIETLASIRKESGNDFLINVDGAINYEHLGPSVRRGANVIVTGIFTVFQQEGGIAGGCAHFASACAEAVAQGYIGDAY